MSKLNDKNINILLGMVNDKDQEINRLHYSIRRKNEDLKNYEKREKLLFERIKELDEQHKRDLYEKELMLADMDSVVQRDKTIEVD